MTENPEHANLKEESACASPPVDSVSARTDDSVKDSPASMNQSSTSETTKTDADSNPPRSDRDELILNGNLRKAVFVLGIPILAEQMLNFLVGFSDTWLSGRISAQATSAIGIAAYVNWLGELLCSFVGTGATALIARHWGAGERSKANRIADSALVLAFVFGIMATVLIYSLAPTLTDVLQLRGESQDIAVRYLRLVCFGQLFSSVLMIGAASLRGSGDTTTPMCILGLVSILNVILSASMVLGIKYTWMWDLGIEGIAYGTVAARIIGAMLMLVALFQGKSGLRAVPSKMAFRDFTPVRRILRIGLPVAVDGVLIWSGHFLFLRVITGIGSDAVQDATFAAHTVGIQIEALNYLPAWAWGTAAATMIGQCLGAGKPDRAKKSGHEAGLQSALVGCTTGLFFFFLPAMIFGFMHNEKLVAEVGVPAMRILALFEIPLATAVCYLVAIRGSGETIRPAIINVVGIYGIRLPLAIWLSKENGLEGAWLAMGIDVTIRAFVILIFFHRGSWARKQI